MPAWTKDELAMIGQAEEIDVTSHRQDGSLRNRVTIWAVRDGDDVYVRSAVRGRRAAWYRGVEESHEGRIWAGSLARDVSFVDVDPALNDKVDAAYRAKYGRYAGRILNSCLTQDARSTTLRISPR